MAGVYSLAAQVLCGRMLNPEGNGSLTLRKLGLIILVGLISLPEDVDVLTALESLVDHGVDWAI